MAFWNEKKIDASSVVQGITYLLIAYANAQENNDSDEAVALKTLKGVMEVRDLSAEDKFKAICKFVYSPIGQTMLGNAEHRIGISRALTNLISEAIKNGVIQSKDDDEGVVYRPPTLPSAAAKK